jgi:hypothetical protein
MEETMLNRPLSLVFNTDPDDAAGTTPIASDDPAQATAPELTTEPSFPAGTAVADMTAEQQAAYWKFHSRKHENDARSKALALEEARQKNMSDEEKRLDDVRRQGELIGAEKFLGDAVHGHLRALTGRSDDEVDNALAFVDTTKFLGADGLLDRTKVAAFASSIGKAAPAAPAGPQNIQSTVAAALQRADSAAIRQGGSIQDRRKELRDQYAAKK